MLKICFYGKNIKLLRDQTTDCNLESGLFGFLSNSQSGVYQLQIVQSSTLKTTPFQFMLLQG